MPRLHAIDPGVSYHACAGFKDNVLCETWLRPNSELPFMLPNVHLVIEKAQFRKGGKVRASDIEDLLYATGWIAARYVTATTYTPSAWKGQVPKKIHHARILEALSIPERDLIRGHNKGTLHHVMDAIGLGLVYLGRMPLP